MRFNFLSILPKYPSSHDALSALDGLPAILVSLISQGNHSAAVFNELVFAALLHLVSPSQLVLLFEELP